MTAKIDPVRKDMVRSPAKTPVSVTQQRTATYTEGCGNVSTQDEYPCQRIGVSGPVIRSASTSAQAGEPIRRHNSPPGSVRCMCVSAAFRSGQ